MANQQVLVLNVSYEPLVLIHWHRAICLVLADKVTVEATEDGRGIRSARAEYPFPAVIRLRRYVSAAPARAVGATRRSVLRRDGHLCAYRTSSPVCVERATSVDHVMPRSRGGGDEPSNLVAACVPCNQRKGDRTPAEMGWAIRTEDAGGEPWPMLDVDTVPVSWRPFLPAAA
ncbi:MAG: HNH endonuclease [Microthrixaceae bacterium]|nr:HNH endonuclease [Microthrixaceae bacterium]